MKFQKKGIKNKHTNTTNKQQLVRKSMCILKDSFHVFTLIYFSLAPLPAIGLFPSRKQVITLVILPVLQMKQLNEG